MKPDLPLRYHEGEITVQKRAGAFDPADLEGSGLSTEFDARASRFLAQQQWALLAAADDERQLWVTSLHGPVGFLAVPDARTLRVHASLHSGDPLSNCFGNATELGMLVLEPAARRRVRVNGRGRWEREGLLHVETREVFGNCPKYIRRREVERVSDEPSGRAMSGLALSAEEQVQIAQSDTFFIGSHHATAGVDCSHRGGEPGFVRVLDERRISFPDYAGNNMFQTLGNLTADPRAGLLFLDFKSGDLLQLTGTAQVIWDSARLAEWPGALRVVEFVIDRVVQTANGSPLRWQQLDN